MTTVSASPSVKPTALQIVNRVLREAGVEEVSSLSPGNPRSNVALEALNDTVWDIYARTLWQWSKSKYTVNLVAGQNDYAMPSDFRSMSLPPKLWNATGGSSSYPLAEYSSAEYDQLVPMQSVSYGTSMMFTVRGGVMSVNPAPSSGTLANYPQMTFEYFKWPQRRLSAQASDDSKTFDVPLELTQAMVFKARSELKKFLEYPDWDADAKQYEQQIAQMLSANKQIRKPYQMRTLYKSNWTI